MYRGGKWREQTPLTIFFREMRLHFQEIASPYHFHIQARGAQEPQQTKHVLHHWGIDSPQICPQIVDDHDRAGRHIRHSGQRC